VVTNTAAMAPQIMKALTAYNTITNLKRGKGDIFDLSLYALGIGAYLYYTSPTMPKRPSNSFTTHKVTDLATNADASALD